MAKLIRPSWAIRCTQSGCRTLFEVAKLEGGKLFWGSFPSFYEVKDKEKMERYQALRSGVNEISGYLQSLVPEEMLK